MFDFSGRSLLLTGASGGIGRAIADVFHKAGANLLLADINESQIQDLARGLDPSGKRAIGVKADVSRPEESGAAVTACLDAFGRLDFVVPAAGIYEEQPFATMTDEQWRRTMTINLDSIFYVCRRAIPVMPEGSSIVLIASEAGHRGATPGHAHYGASKGGVLGLTRSLARELAPKIRVNSVSPGTIDTPMVADLMRDWGDALLATTPMKRLGAPREVADVVAFLCSDAAAYVTGQTIHPNGGSYIGG